MAWERQRLTSILNMTSQAVHKISELFPKPVLHPGHYLQTLFWLCSLSSVKELSQALKNADWHFMQPPFSKNDFDAVLKLHDEIPFLQNRTINHKEGSHGVPGIFVKYDLSSLLIRVREEHKPYWQFLVRLCGIIGGIFSVSGQCTSALLHYLFT